MRRLLREFIRNEQGLETVEYAVITSIIVAGTILAILSIATLVNARFATLDTEVHTSP